MRWFETPNIDFVSKRKIAYIFSSILVIISIGAIVTKGLQYGIDFKGGKELVLKFESAVDVTEIRSSLTDPLGSTPEVKLFGSESEVLIRTDNIGTIEEIENIVRSNMAQLYPDNDAITEKRLAFNIVDIKTGTSPISYEELVDSLDILEKFVFPTKLATNLDLGNS